MLQGSCSLLFFFAPVHQQAACLPAGEGSQRVWAQQVGTAGARKFILATVDEIASTILAAQAAPSLYEVVSSGYAVRPYFDLEYSRTANPARTAQTDKHLVDSILYLVDRYIEQQGWDGCVDHARTVVLDASNAAKFSRHIIVHLSNNAALAGVGDAGALTAWVCSQLAPDLLMAAAPDGGTVSVVDKHVYHRKQQMRLLGCVKLGDNRVLRQLQLAQCSLADTLLCTASPAQRFGRGRDSSSGFHEKAGGTSTASAGVLAAALTAQVEAALHGGHVHSVHLHSRHGTAHPSIYAHTTSTTCAHRQHASNKAVVEVNCRQRTWRILCRDGCQPGPWQQVHSQHSLVGPAAPQWLQSHCATWDKNSFEM